MFASLHTATLATRTIGARKSAPAGGAFRLTRLIATAMAAHRQRQALARLDDHMLRDLGLTRDAAQTEADRPFWDVPQHWLR